MSGLLCGWMVLRLVFLYLVFCWCFFLVFILCFVLLVVWVRVRLICWVRFIFWGVCLLLLLLLFLLELLLKIVWLFFWVFYVKVFEKNDCLCGESEEKLLCFDLLLVLELVVRFVLVCLMVGLVEMDLCSVWWNWFWIVILNVDGCGWY